ncbi:MAG: chromosome segregation ATPase [Methanosarcina sp.]|nr:MAG: chromosome segregation ATPase [Methanosarcina sp.]
MKKSRIVRYLAYITFILILFCILPGGSLATKDSSGHGSGVQYTDESTTGSETGSENSEKYSVEDANGNTGSENNEKDSIEDANGTENSDPENMQDQDRVRIQDQDQISAYKLERKQIHEELQLQKNEYREAKEDFLKVRNQIRAGKLDPNSEEAVTATRLYLNSSINYMRIHLENVKTNMQHSNGNGTEERNVAIDENIKQLEAEQAEVANASSQQEFLFTVRSVRGIWNNAQKTSLTGAGQTVSQKIREFLTKSGNLSEKLGTEIESLNETGVNTATLETRLTSYNLYLKAAQDKKEAADSIYEDENATRENLEVANNYLRESLNNVNKANQILRVIFDELKEYNFEEFNNNIGVENSIETELNNTTSINNTNNNLSV